MPELLFILLVESDPNAIFFLSTALNDLQTQGIQAQLEVVTNLTDALEALSEHVFDLIILDLNLADSKGLDTFLEIQKKANSSPLIVAGRNYEENIAREVVKLGAQDYLSQVDLNVGLLPRIIHHAIERHRLHVSLKALSFMDELTQIYNRRGFFTLLQQQIALASRMKKGFYLFLVDLDDLKHTNDTYGHLMGDKVLIDAAKCLLSSFRHYDIIGRLGGDEFAILSINATFDSGDSLKEHLIQKIKEYNLQIKDPYQLSFSIGKAYYDGASSIDMEDLFQQADQELYQAKRVAHRQK